MKWLKLLWRIVLAAIGVETKPDPIADAREEGKARQRAEDHNAQLEAALKGEEAARRAETRAHAAEVRYQDEIHEAEKPVPVPRTEAELKAILDAGNEARRRRGCP